MKYVVLRYNIVMKLKFIKIDFDSDTVKLMSERINILSWALGGLNYMGFNLQGITRIAVTVVGWLILQYISFAFLKVSRTLKKEENDGINKNIGI